MSSSRIFLVGNSIFRPHKPSLPLSFNRFPSASLRLRCFSVAVESDVQSPPLHPWPEWINFVDRLKTKGYLTKDDEEDDMVYQEMNLVKEACLKFARERYDILRSLSSRDVQALVERRCANLNRKVVNSSKRIRAHVGLDEADVCASCELRASCDRAYVILKGAEADARTVDVMRLLLFNALDKDVVEGVESAPGNQLVYESARRLLLELVQFSEKPLDPALPKPASRVSLPPKERVFKPRIAERSPRGPSQYSADWTCPKCDFVNFSRNERCRECNEVADRRPVAAVVKEGDWLCSECNYLNFSRNQSCLKCKAKGPSVGNAVEMKKGDWNCSRCGFMNFSSNKQCRKCPEPRPKRQLEPGEWECPSCNFVNFRRNTVCKTCDCKRPRESSTHDDGHSWKRPALF